MATVGARNDNHRNGAVRKRSQVFNPQNGHWVERNLETGRFMAQKADDKPFKGVRKERPSRSR